MSRIRFRIAGGAAVLLLAGLVMNASGQTVIASEWQRGTTLGGFAGAASPGGTTGMAAGFTLGWEIAPHFTFEGRGVWLDEGRRSDAFTALLGARVPLLPARPAVPFLAAAAGVYRATFESMSAGMPRFYHRRMPASLEPFESRTFHDFVVAMGGGVDLFPARHLSVRPEVTVLLVTTRRDTRAVPMFGVSLAYHFEDHPITPSR